MALSLTEESVDELAKTGPGWLAKHRLGSFAKFNGMPLESSELFKKHVNIDLDIGEFALKKNGFPAELGFILGSGVTFIQPSGMLMNNDLPSGVVLTDMMKAVRNHEGIVRKYFSEPETKLEALNESFFGSGYFLYVPDNTVIDKPIRILTTPGLGGSALFTKNVAVLGKNCSARIVEEFYSPEMERSLASSVTSIHAGEGSHASMGCIQSLGSGVLFTLKRKVILEKDAHLTSSSGFFGGAATLSRFDSVMKDGASSEDYEVVFGSSAQRYDITSNIIHRGMNTNGKVVIKGVFDGASSGIFKGMIDISRDAKYANAYLSEHSMLLGKEAKADAIPGLEISNNEVKATHSASVAQINEDEMFYLMARGLGSEQAKKLIVLGFFDPLFRQVPSGHVKLLLRGLLEIKWERKELFEIREVMERILHESAAEETSSKDIFERHYKYR
ncbi:MAG: SufD family Fe-S cluster assembly protein [Candidatus Aenigmarchaeota archaeon]|nr:SufD family Fe-S cluster assembly protein [Candidatus Aenigmarchaeota archaeon]